MRTLGSLLLLLLASCSHTMGYREFEKEIVQPGSKQVRHELHLGDGVPDEMGVLKLQVTHTLIERYRVFKEMWSERKYAAYNPLFDIALKPVVTAFGLAFGGIILWENLTADPPPDRDGDGDYDAGEYFGDLIAWFNPFEAAPLGVDGREKTLLSSTRKEGQGKAKEKRKDRVLKRTTVQVHLSTPTARATLRGLTDKQGRAAISLAPKLPPLVGEPIEVRVTTGAGSGKLERVLPTIPALRACEMLRKKAGKRAFARVPRSRRAKVIGVYLGGIDRLAGVENPADRVDIARMLLDLDPKHPELVRWAKDLYRRAIASLIGSTDEEKALALALDAGRRFTNQADWKGIQRDLRLRIVDKMVRGGAWEKALDQGAGLVALAPGNTEIRKRVRAVFADRVGALDREGRLGPALKVARRGLRLFAGDEAWSQQTLGLYRRWIDTLMKKGKEDLALDAGQELLAEWSGRPEVVQSVNTLFGNRVDRLRKSGDLRQALATARRAAGLLPKDERWSALAVTLQLDLVRDLLGRDVKEAIAEGKACLKVQGRKSTAAETLESLYRDRFRRLREARKLDAGALLGMEILRLFPGSTQESGEVGILVEARVRQLWAGGRHREALALAGELLGRVPFDRPQWTRIDKLYRQRVAQLAAQGKPSEALTLARRWSGRTRSPIRDGWSTIIAGLREMEVQRLVARGEWKKGLREAESLARSNRRNAPLRKKLATLFHRRMVGQAADGDRLAALGTGRRMLRLFPEQKGWREEVVNLHWQVVRSHWEGGRHDRALNESRQLLAWYGKSAVHASAVADLYRQRLAQLEKAQDWAAAAELAVRAEKLFPGQPDWSSRGVQAAGRQIRSLWDKGQGSKAMAYARHSLKIHTDSKALRELVGKLYADHAQGLIAKERKKEAMDLAVDVLPLLPGRQDLHRAARVFFEKCIQDAAKEGGERRVLPILTKALQLFPKDPGMTDRLGRYLKSTNGILTLAEAVDNGLVEARMTGGGIQRVSVQLKRISPLPLKVKVTPGTFFVCRGKAQNMVTTESRVVDLTRTTSRSLSVPAACANRTRAIPRGGSSFSVRSMPFSADLAKLAPHLPGQRYAVKQAAVWIVTDNATRSHLRKLVRRRVGQVFGGVSVIGDTDILKAIDLLDKAGINWSRKRIAGWVNSKRKAKAEAKAKAKK